MGKDIIRLHEIWKTYVLGKVKVHAVCNVSLTLKRGEFLAITGKSGSGKSTVMHLMSCLDTPSKGKIFLDSREISTMNESQLANIRGKKIGFIFQQFNLIPTFTALENVILPGEFQNNNTHDLIVHGKKLLEFVDMGERMNHKPNELSGGQLQRVAIARALINDPEVILADEPTGNLDSKTGVQVMSLLKELNMKEKKSVVIVTHDPLLVKYANRVIELKDGQIIKEYMN